MAKPVPSEPVDSVMVRPPMSIANEARELASRSRDATGRPLSINRYMTEILRDAVQRGVVIHLEEKARFVFDRFMGAADEAAWHRLNEKPTQPPTSGGKKPGPPK